VKERHVGDTNGRFFQNTFILIKIWPCSDAVQGLKTSETQRNILPQGDNGKEKEMEPFVKFPDVSAELTLWDLSAIKVRDCM
jgi:hypothetical protein